MGLRSDIQTSLTEAMANDLLDVVASFTLVKFTDGAYNPVTGVTSTTETEYEGKGIFGSYGADEINGESVKSEDEKIIVNGNDLAVAPEINDVVRLASGTEYFIVKPAPIMGGDTTAIIYEMQVRKNV
jgi:hypothetical protein